MKLTLRKIRRPSLSVSLATLLLGFSVSAQTHDSKTTSFQLGDKVVVIPDPEGFEEAASQFERIKKYMSDAEDPALDTLAIHLPIDDCAKLRKGEFGPYNFYTKISVRRAIRAREISETEFSKTVAEF